MRLVRALASAAVLIVLVLAVPVALVAYGHLPAVDGLAELPGEMMTDTTAFALLTVLAWLAWALLVVVVVVELVTQVAGAQHARLPAALPFQPTVRRLVAALTMTASLSGPMLVRPGLAPAGAEANAPALVTEVVTHRAPAAAAVVAEPPPTAAAPAAPVALATPERVTVTVGDTPWGLAERHLGSGLRWREIWDLNRGRPQPDGRTWVTEDLILVGWLLDLPAGAVPAAAPPPTPAPPSPAEAAPEPVPPPAVDTTASPDSRGPGTAADESDEADHDRATNSQPTRQEEAAATSPATAPAADRPSSEGTAGDAEPPGAGATGAPTEGESDSLVPGLLGIAGATVVATALARHVRRRRRQRLHRGAHVEFPPVGEDEARTEGALVAAADLPLVQWAGHHLAALVTSLPPGRLEGAPVAVELSEEDGIELLWDRPNPEAPRPWTPADDGWAWRLGYDVDAPTPANDDAAGIPGLVTIGRRFGRQLLVDLEAFGAVALVGDPDRVADLARAIVIELGTGDELASAQVTVAGVEALVSPGAAEVEVVATAAAALPGVRATVAAMDDVLPRSFAPSTFDYRLGGDAWTDVVAVVARSDDTATPSLVAASRPRRGVASVVLGAVEGAGATVTVDGDGHARIESDLLAEPVAFEAAGLPEETADAVASLLEALDREPVVDGEDPATPVSVPDWAMEESSSGGAEGVAAVDPAGDPDCEVPETPSDAPAVAPAAIVVPTTADSGGVAPPGGGVVDGEAPEWPERPELMVRVLGTPRVPDRPELKRRHVQLVVYLASMGQPTSVSRVEHAVWAGETIASKTVWNNATRARKILGTLSDGTQALLPSIRDQNRMQLSPRVRTDLQYLSALYAHAQQASSAYAIDLLTEGLGLVEGQPYDGADYEWAHHSEMLVAEAHTVIEDAAMTLVDLATDAGRVDLARFAVTQGLRALRGNEVLYRARMRVEANAGNLPAVHASYRELVSYLTDIDSEPSRPTIDLYDRLTKVRGRQAS